jgi:thiosulfate dehydrogenase
MLKGFFTGVGATIVVALVGAYLVLQNGLIPANADVRPNGLEIWAASTSLEATLRREAPKGPNPVAMNDVNLIAGIKLYAQHCAICHGTAKGEATVVARGLYTKPPQLATTGVEDDPEGFSFWKIKHGIRWTAMPSWKDALDDRDIWTLALFLKHMNKLPPAPKAAWENLKNLGNRGTPMD